MKQVIILPRENRWSRGDVHPFTGLFFWCYARGYINGERWVTPEVYETKKARLSQYHTTNSEMFRAAKKKHRLKDPEHTRRKNRQYRVNTGNAVLRERESRRHHSDPLFAMARGIRSRLRGIINYGEFSKNTAVVLGCNAEEFIAHIERQFEEGMGWHNRSEWHFDHIIPLSSAKSKDEMIILGHHSNVRPLWALDNFRKGCRMPQPECANH